MFNDKLKAKDRLNKKYEIEIGYNLGIVFVAMCVLLAIVILQ